MRKTAFFLFLFMMIGKSSWSQTPLYRYDFRINNLKGSFRFVFDSITTNKTKIYFAYDSSTTIRKVWADSSLIRPFSEWEFRTKTDTLAARVLRDSVSRINPAEAALLRTDAKILIFQQLPEWTDKVIKKANALTLNTAVVSKVATDPPTYSVRFNFPRDTAYKCTIAPEDEEFDLKVCKIDVPNKKDTCASARMDKDIAEADFKILFIKKMGMLTPVNIETQLKPLDSIAGKFYRKWKKDVLEFKKEQGEIKAEAETNALTNKQLNSILTIVDSFNKAKRDSATADFTVTLSSRQLYYRKKNKSYELPDDADPLRHRPSYSYKKLSGRGSKISLDSLSITTENGYITSIIIYPDTNDVDKYHLNKLTAIRRHFDLRSTREAGENLNYYFPLESDEKVYIKRRLTTKKSREISEYNIFEPIFLNVSDIISYKPKIDSIGDVLVEVTNRNLGFSKDNPNKGKVILKEKSLSSFVRLDIFTDLVGLAEDKPNGIIQAEAKADIGLFTQPMGNAKYYSRYRYHFLHSANVNLRLSKVENKLRFLPVARDSVRFYNKDKDNYHDDTLTGNTKFVRTIDILQYASLDASIKFNLFRFHSDFFIFNAFVGGGIVRIPLNDTITGQSNGIPILQENKTVTNALKFNYGIQGQFKITHNIGAEMAAEMISLRLNRSDIIQVFNKYDDTKRKDMPWQSPPSGIIKRQLILLGVKLYNYFDRDQQKRLYIRLQYFKDMRTHIDDFFSFQFGYSTDIKGLVNVFKKEDK